jgi:hypothetical protein
MFILSLSISAIYLPSCLLNYSKHGRDEKFIFIGKPEGNDPLGNLDADGSAILTGF